MSDVFLQDLIKSIEPLDESAMELARKRQHSLTKPRGSLGFLEDVSVRLAGITRDSVPRLSRKAVILMAADHGVARRGVSLYPQEVTVQMILNFLSGGAAINALAALAGARLVVCDAGVAADLPDHPQLIKRPLGWGTKDISEGPAMSRGEALASLKLGAELVLAEVDRGLDAVATGEMGIGNTTAAAAVAAAMTGLPAESCVGRGTGLDDSLLAFKAGVVNRALDVNRPSSGDPIGVLAKVGGFEIGGLAGVILGAASRRVPVVLDGFISTSAALIAHGLNPLAAQYMFAGHLSAEAGHGPCLKHLGLRPLLDLGMRLGEGTGAALAFILLEAASKTMAEMATFAEAGVSGPK